MYSRKPVILRPYLAINRRALRADHVALGRIDVCCCRQRPYPERLRALVEARNSALIHHAKPEIPSRVRAQPERSRGEPRLEFRQRIFGDAARSGIKLAQVGLAKA